MFVDFNQNAPHKTVFAAWGARARPAARCRRRSRGTSSTTIDPDELTIAVGARARAAQGDPWAAIGDRAESLDAARAVRARPGERPDGRAVAAGLSQEAERAAAGRAEPRA